jgi:predicted enzyme related to lactoylglutathione lyase
MFTYTSTFSSFSIDDIEKAKDFYGSILGVTVAETPMGLELQVKGNAPVFLYHKSDHVPATFTVLNFVVPDIEQAVDSLTAKGVAFEHYEGAMKTDEKGIMRSQGNGSEIAWFKDPAGNFLSLIKE